MNGFARVLPFLWPHRRKVLLSVVFALLVGLLWGANLSVAFPVVKVLLQGESLGDYVRTEIAEAEKELAGRTRRLDQVQSELVRRQDDPPVRLLREQADLQSKIASASRKVLLMRWVEARVIPWVPRDQFDTFAVILAALMIATLLKGVFLFLQERLVGTVVELTVFDIRKHCFRHALSLDYQTLMRNGTAELMARFTNDANVLATGLNLLGGKVIREPIKALSCVVLALLVNWRLTLLSFVFAPLAVYVFYRIGKQLKRASHRLMESMSRIYKVLEETFDGLKVVIAFDGARRHRQRFHRENKEYFAKSMRIVTIDALASPVTELFGLAAVFVALLPGAYLVLRDATSIWGIKLASSPMDIAELAVLYASLLGMIDPVRKLSSVYARLKRSAAAADRLFAMLDRQTLLRRPKRLRDLPRHARDIEFRNVSFRYLGDENSTESRPAALENVSLKVAAGEVIAVVGENGSGKSTLVQLLPRYFDPDGGAVLVDGVDLREVRPRDLRRQIGVVTQETILFDESIADNIRYGNPGASQQAIDEAAARAHVTAFIDQLPEGFHTRVGEKGGNLSGGQRQRIALARAILRDPSILILDEATSAVDSQSEFLIHQTLQSFVHGRTTFIITHSVSQSVLDLVTRIAVMDGGRLVACGTHAELLETCPVYQRLIASQVRQHSAPEEDARSRAA